MSDLLDLRVGDLWTPEGEPRREFSTRAQKTGSLAITQINQAVREAMTFAEPDVPTYDPDALLFQVSRRMASRWVKTWCRQVGIDRGTYSAHFLRKTFAYQLWLEQGKTDEALGHQSTGVTMDDLGIRREQIAHWQTELNL